MTVLPQEALEDGDKPVNLSSTFDDSTLEAPVRERFLRNLRAVEAVLAGVTVVDAAREHQIARSTLSRLVQRTRTRGVLACVPHGTYSRERDLHPAFQEVIRRLYLLPTKLSMTAITEHADLKRAAKRVQEDTGTPIPLPSPFPLPRNWLRSMNTAWNSLWLPRMGFLSPIRFTRRSSCV